MTDNDSLRQRRKFPNVLSTTIDSTSNFVALDVGSHTAGLAEERVCILRRQQSSTELFFKSLKFFSFFFVVGTIVGLLLQNVIGINRIYLYFVVGFMVSTLASYYKFRVWLNPDYKPDCDCTSESPSSQQESLIPSTDDMMNGVFTVLDHKKSALVFNIPNTVLGMMFYVLMIWINYYLPLNMANSITLIFTVISCIGSVYLWYTMITEVKSVCVLCSTIHAVSFLTLFTFLHLLF